MTLVLLGTQGAAKKLLTELYGAKCPNAASVMWVHARHICTSWFWGDCYSFPISTFNDKNSSEEHGSPTTTTEILTMHCSLPPPTHCHLGTKVSAFQMSLPSLKVTGGGKEEGACSRQPQASPCLGHTLMLTLTQSHHTHAHTMP